MAKPESITWTEYVARLEEAIKAHSTHESFLIQSKTTASDQVVYRPISELRQELAMARQNAASERLGSTSPFISDCGL